MNCGIKLMLLGMGFVFVFLFLLYKIISLTSALLSSVTKKELEREAALAAAEAAKINKGDAAVIAAITAAVTCYRKN